VAALLAVLAAGSRVSAQRPSADALASLASKYVATFFDRFANVVAEERYQQDVGAVLSSNLLIGRRGGGSPTLPPQSTHRTLKSDFLLVTLPDSHDLMPFRDTFEVDGADVRDRQDRLAKLFLKPSADAVAQAKAIAAESARYNIGNVQRTVNDPVLALSFLQAINRGRLALTVDKLDPAMGRDVWVVEYREEGRPTFVRGPQDRDMPAHGRYWIASTTGQVLRSELVLQDPTIIARITTSFRTDDRFNVDVPSEMREEYTVGGTLVTGNATYGRFRRFAVATDEEMKKQ
jgi:hypothetical protein